MFQRQSKSFRWKMLGWLGLLLCGFILVDIPHPFNTEEDAINVRNIQSSGHTNQYPIGTYLLTQFTDQWKALYVKQCNVCTLMWSRIGSWPSNSMPPASVCQVDCTIPGCSCGGGGGSCAIVDPMNSILAVDGQRGVLPVAGEALTRLGVAEDGRSIVLDEYAVVHAGRRGIELERTSSGFHQSPDVVAALVSYSGLNRLQTVAGKRSADIDAYAKAEVELRSLGETRALVIQHQREHPANHNFAPIPHVTFKSQPFADPAAQGQRGFAVVDFGESGHVLNVEVMPSHGMTPPGLLASAISDGLRTQFKDQRRHDHRAYLAYRIGAGAVQLAGEPVVTLPMCCPGPGGPGEQCGQMHCEEN